MVSDSLSYQAVQTMSMYWHELIYLLVCQVDFFIISTTFECITIGHFTGLIVNGNKIMTEIKLLKIIERR